MMPITDNSAIRFFLSRRTPRTVQLGSYEARDARLRESKSGRTSKAFRIYVREPQDSAAQSRRNPSYLSDLVTFQSDRDGDRERSAASRNGDADEVIDRASQALERARQALEKQQEHAPSRPSNSVFTFASNRNGGYRQDLSSSGTVGKKAEEYGSVSQEDKRASLEDVLSAMQDPDSDSATLIPSSSPGPELVENRSPSATPGPPGQDSFASAWQEPEDAQPQLLKAQEAQPKQQRQLQFAERSDDSLEMPSQDAQDAEAAKSAVLPPFQSVLELTTAAAPPQRGELLTSAESASTSAGRYIEDGEGKLADGTTFKRESGETKGARGYWYRWTKLSGISPAGQVEWEEKWWEASDWAGMKELGAEKSGCRADGSAWRETWREAIGYDEGSGEPMVERTAHKWAKDAKGDEWEEKWGEHYWSQGKAHKWADKWGKDGGSVWHERWGEDYKGKDACFRFTDKWAEKRVEGGGLEQWGDKWEEDFAGGKGSKKGETWSIDTSGQRYQRWWGENHFGEGWVQKYGNSSTGEQWDVNEQMDTYYNPIPHFGYRHALDHSPTLKNVPMLPRAGDDLGEGISSL